MEAVMLCAQACAMPEEALFFPSLEELTLVCMSNLKKSMPLWPNLEELKLVNDTLSVLTMSTTGGVVGTISASSPGSYSKLKSLWISNVKDLIPFRKCVCITSLP
uniref:Uncharacterized protein n=1 Tax=Opuntia streptacantha TaxID=393608 RepID=A0A7C9CWM3_OPUST